MHTIKLILVMLMCTMVLGCLSQQTHDRVIEELEMTSQQSVQKAEHLQQEAEHLQQVVQEQEAVVAQLQKEKQGLEETLDRNAMKVGELEHAKQAFEETLRAKDTTVLEFRKVNNDLEAEIEVQEQLKEQNIERFKQELQDLYSQVRGLGGMSGAKPTNFSLDMNDGEIDFDDIAKAFQDVRATLASQMGGFSQLREQNGQLEEELQKLEARLRNVERLKKELEQVRADREAQEAKLAKVRHEVQTVGKEIDRITKALEEKFGKSLVVTQHQDRLVLTMLGQVLFESGQAQLTPLGLDIMKQVGEVLATLPKKNIQVEGHTDNNPIYGRLQRQYPTNWELSTARATTVLRFLIEQTGMNPQDFAATGYADTRPAVGNDTEEGQAQNRRVEIVLYPEQVGESTTTVATLAQ